MVSPLDFFLDDVSKAPTQHIKLACCEKPAVQGHTIGSHSSEANGQYSLSLRQLPVNLLIAIIRVNDRQQSGLSRTLTFDFNSSPASLFSLAHNRDTKREKNATSSPLAPPSQQASDAWYSWRMTLKIENLSKFFLRNES